ncbi:endonuclease [Hydrogenophaga palleronii]|uniref:endonuclease n=1 Tax=Hydrogenophaga palleronii TaxID=65655 RepID=UPI000824B576|nr:endonuclease [Hydrogenophaga palleronii]
MTTDISTSPARGSAHRYKLIIAHIFKTHYRAGSTGFDFNREEINEAATFLKLPLIKNVGDLPYTFRYRVDLPEEITSTAKAGYEWIIRGAGQAMYRFKQIRKVRISPREELVKVKIPDATPEIIVAYAMTDEQALLAKVRYNRLIDIFLGVTTYSLQSHLRTTVKDIGQIEIDEVYVGVDRNGGQYIIPVQAKGGSDRHGVTQTEQDILWCAQRFPNLKCRAISAQFTQEGHIVMFELTLQQEQIFVVDERHYQLVPANSISAEDLRTYAAK